MTKPAVIERLPWEKQKSESSPAWGAFVLYRDLGPQRSTTKVMLELGKSKALIQGWCKKHAWVERADAYDRHVDSVHRQASEENWRVANHRHQVIAGQITTSLMRRLVGDANPNRPVSALDPNDIDWSDVRGLARDSMAMERLSHGQPTDFALKVTMMSTTEAISHVRMLVEIARKHMSPETFQAFMVEYASATAAAAGTPPPRPKEITA